MEAKRQECRSRAVTPHRFQFRRPGPWQKTELRAEGKAVTPSWKTTLRGLGCLVALWCITEHCAGQTSVTVGHAPGYPGATVNLPVHLRQGSNVVAVQFDVAFHSGKVSALDALRGAQLTNHVFRSRQIAPGVERVLIYSLNNAAVALTNLAVATLPLTLSPTEFVSSGPLVPTNVVLAKADATALVPVSGNSGVIFVRPVNRNQDGTVQFFLPSQPDTHYLIQATTDFLHWVNLTNVTALGSFMDLVDTDAAQYPHRFYRWVIFDAAGEIGAITQSLDGGLSFKLNSIAGRAYTLQASTDLQHWSDLTTNVATAGSLSFTNLMQPGIPHRFFRLKSGP